MKRNIGIIATVGMGSIVSNAIGRIKEQSREIIIVQATEQFDNKCFEREPITLNCRNEMPPLIELYDKKGKPLELPKSKYHK